MTIAALVFTFALNAFAAGSKITIEPVVQLNVTTPADTPPLTCKPQKIVKKASLTFPDGKTIHANVVDTPRSREIGMMCLTKLSKDYGMLFVFPQEMPLNFWMKNTLVSLDMVWIGADKKVTVVHDHMKKSTVDTPDDQVAVAAGVGEYVLELPAGAAARHKLKPGSPLKFAVAIPDK